MKEPVEVLLQKPLESFLPHSHPMVLIRSIEQLDEHLIECKTRFQDAAFFGCKQGVPIAWSVEIIAQACALFVAIHKYGTNITTGRLLKCGGFEFRTPYLPYDQELMVSANLDVAGDSGLWIFEGTIKDQTETLLAGGNMNILVQ